MKRLFLLLALAFALGARAESALFIGDSLTGAKNTATNEDMPSVLAHLAAARSHAFTFSEAIDLGETLQTNWDAGIPEPFLTGSTKWDFVSYQEFSTLATSSSSGLRSTATRLSLGGSGTPRYQRRRWRPPPSRSPFGSRPDRPSPSA